MTKRADLFGHDSKNSYYEGLGDTIAGVVNAVTRGKLKKCRGCQKRKEILNRLLPYVNPTNG